MPAKKRITKAAPVARQLTHLDERGRVRMVDVGAKPVTRREAVARGEIRMAAATLDGHHRGPAQKGRGAGDRADRRNHGGQAHHTN